MWRERSVLMIEGTLITLILLFWVTGCMELLFTEIKPLCLLMITQLSGKSPLESYLGMQPKYIFLYCWYSTGSLELR